MDTIPSQSIVVSITKKHIQYGLTYSQPNPVECAIAEKLRIRHERVCCLYDYIIISTLNFGQTPEFSTQITETPDVVREWLAQWDSGPKWSKPLVFELSVN